MSETWYPAPAKLNLMLRVVGRRADGYHLLQTIFQFIDLCDHLSFVSLPAGAGVRRLHGVASVAEADDLSVRAVRHALHEAGRSHEGIGVRLKKRIPIGGGIGGGSSDAATALMVVNHLLGLGFSQEDLQALALQLGADVPVFVSGQASWAEGVGERLTPLSELPERWYLLVHPGVFVATKEIFCAPELTRDHQALRISPFPEGGNVNTLEDLVRIKYPEVDKVFSWFAKHGAQEVSMSGSGSCVFGAWDAPCEPMALASKVPSEWCGFVVKGENRHPLYSLVVG